MHLPARGKLLAAEQQRSKHIGVGTIRAATAQTSWVRNTSKTQLADVNGKSALFAVVCRVGSGIVSFSLHEPLPSEASSDLPVIL